MNLGEILQYKGEVVDPEGFAQRICSLESYVKSTDQLYQTALKIILRTSCNSLIENEHFTKDSFLGIASTLEIIDKEERTDEIVQNIISLFEGVKYPLSIKNVLKNVSSDKRKEFLHLIQPISNSFKDKNCMPGILSYLLKLPESEWKGCIEAMMPLTNVLKSSHEYMYCLHNIVKSPQEERKSLVIQALKLYEGIDDEYEVCYFIKCLRMIPFQERGEIVEDTLPLLLSMSHADDRKDALKSLQFIDSAGRKEIAQKGLEILKKITSGNSAYQVVCFLAKTPKEDWDRILKQAKLFFEGVPNGSIRGQLLQILSVIPQNITDSVIRLSLPHIGEVKENTPYFILYLSQLPKRKEVIEKLIHVVNRLNIKFFGFFPLFAPQHRLRALQTLIDHLPGPDTEQLLEQLFQDDEIREESIHFLEKTLDTQSNEACYISYLCSLITNNFDLLQLPQTHRLFQKTIDAVLKAKPADRKRKKTPTMSIVN